MSTATQGRAREYLVRDDLIDAGYPAIMRAAASKGAADLLHGHEFIGSVLVQVGTGNKTLGPAARARFIAAAELTCSLPILATVIATPGKKTVIRYWLVTEGEPRTWEEWSP